LLLTSVESQPIISETMTSEVSELLTKFRQSAAMDFALTLRRWRATRRYSQLDLAGEAAISARHLACLETGKARPSRGMVLTLAEALDLPKGDTNRLLEAAGFVAEFPVLPLEAAEMAQVRQAMDWTVNRHAPYPAVVMDRLWRITALNKPAERLFGPMGFQAGTSLLAVLDGETHPKTFIGNWGEVAHHTLSRLRMESARAGGIPELDRAAAKLAQDPDLLALRSHPDSRAVIPTIYRAGPLRLSLFSLYAGFGSAEEVALAEMKIELMFPADAESERFFAQLTAS
jgi:transcriptional regulator with XRE-family HTH domain